MIRVGNIKNLQDQAWCVRFGHRKRGKSCSGSSWSGTTFHIWVSSWIWWCLWKPTVLMAAADGGFSKLSSSDSVFEVSLRPSSPEWPPDSSRNPAGGSGTFRNGSCSSDPLRIRSSDRSRFWRLKILFFWISSIQTGAANLCSSSSFGPRMIRSRPFDWFSLSGGSAGGIGGMADPFNPLSAVIVSVATDRCSASFGSDFRCLANRKRRIRATMTKIPATIPPMSSPERPDFSTSSEKNIRTSWRCLY